MSETPHIDPLAQLWQSASEPDTRQLMLDLKRLQKTHQWQNRIVVLILCGVALVLLFAAVALRSWGLGIITALWIAFVAGAIWYQRARCSAADALDLDTVSLLKRMITRARRGLTQARRLYAGVPLAAGASAAVTRMFAPRLAFGGHAAAPWVTMTYTAACLIMLAVMIIAGLVMARARQRQLRELTEKLRSLEDGL